MCRCATHMHGNLDSNKRGHWLQLGFVLDCDLTLVELDEIPERLVLVGRYGDAGKFSTRMVGFHAMSGSHGFDHAYVPRTYNNHEKTTKTMAPLRQHKGRADRVLFSQLILKQAPKDLLSCFRRVVVVRVREE